MFAGHLGAALLLKRSGRDVGLGTLFLSVMLLDVVLWVLVLVGVEFVRMPINYRAMADLNFDFPYSHGLAAAVGWSAAAFALYWRISRHLAGAAVVTAAVFSHFLLDCLVHVPELPVAGRTSTMLGLGWWRNLPLAWSVEAAFVVAGLCVYLKTNAPPPGRRIALAVALMGVTVMTILGQASKSTPPTPKVMAASSLITIALLVLFGRWIEGGRESRPK